MAVDCITSLTRAGSSTPGSWTRDRGNRRGRVPESPARRRQAGRYGCEWFRWPARRRAS